jgi:hypothetical protein
MQHVKALEIEIAPVHHVEGTRLRDENIEHIDIVQLAIGDVDECRDGTAQIEQCVQFHRGLGRAKWRPGKYRQAQVDGSGVERT